MISDLQLVKLTKEGHLEAFESLIGRYKDKVYNIAFSFTANASESDDIAQNVFLKIYSNLNSFKEEAAFSTWMYRITVNECYNGLKKRKNTPLPIDAEIKAGEDLTLKDVLEDKKANVEKILISEEAQKAVRQCIAALPAKYKMIVTLREIEDLQYEEIADAMDISVNKVKVWLFRAREKLKKLLKKQGNLL